VPFAELEQVTAETQTDIETGFAYSNRPRVARVCYTTSAAAFHIALFRLALISNLKEAKAKAKAAAKRPKSLKRGRKGDDNGPAEESSKRVKRGRKNSGQVDLPPFPQSIVAAGPRDFGALGK
jgi:hypothetical protein